MKITYITKNKNFVRITALHEGVEYESTQRFYEGRRPGHAETQWAEQAALHNLGVMIAQKAMSEYQRKQQMKEAIAVREKEIITKTFGKPLAQTY